MPSKEQTADRDDQSTDCNLQRKKQATISTALKPAYQLLVNTSSTSYISPKGATFTGTAMPKVMKPLPVTFSSKCFPLKSAMETSDAGSSSESGFAEPSDKTGSKEKYPKLSQNLPTFKSEDQRKR